MTYEEQYLDLLRRTLKDGEKREDRTGTGTLSLFGAQLRADLREGFPLLTTKKVHWNSVVHELLWFISGDTNVKYLQDNGVRIWNEWIRKENNPGTNFSKRPLIWIDPIKKQYVSYNGDFLTAGIKASRNSTEDKLRNIWIRMMRRCYDKNHHRYGSYGAKGIFVQKRWHEVANFIEDAPKIKNYSRLLEDWNSYELDKDYYGSNCYGPDTCVFLHTSENNFYTTSSFPVKVIDNTGQETIYITLNECSRKTGIPPSTLSRFINDGIPATLKGNNKQYVDWQFLKISKNNKILRHAFSYGDLGPVYGKQWRNWATYNYSRSSENEEEYWRDNDSCIDQLQSCIDSIKANPYSRRHIVSSWNVAELEEMALPPCHLLYQFYCHDDGGLSLQLYQRSADLFLGEHTLL